MGLEHLHPFAHACALDFEDEGLSGRSFAPGTMYSIHPVWVARSVHGLQSDGMLRNLHVSGLGQTFLEEMRFYT